VLSVRTVVVRTFSVALLSAFAISQGLAQDDAGALRLRFTTFTVPGVPGAYQTAGGGVNDKQTMAGHWADSSCVSSGYTVKF